MGGGGTKYYANVRLLDGITGSVIENRVISRENQSEINLTLVKPIQFPTISINSTYSFTAPTPPTGYTWDTVTPDSVTVTGSSTQASAPNADFTLHYKPSTTTTYSLKVNNQYTQSVNNSNISTFNELSIRNLEAAP